MADDTGESPALEAAVKAIKICFETPTQVLKDVSEAMSIEFEKGLTNQGGSIPMHPTWVLDKPSGAEQGTFLGIDLGRTIKGTNLRVCEVQFTADRQFDITQSSFRVPSSVKTGKSEELWEFVATSVQTFLDLNNERSSGRPAQRDIHLAFTFSFPLKQESIDEGILEKWLRGFAVKDVEGRDVVELLQHALDKKGIPVKVVAVLNDCVGTLVASAYTEPNVAIGCIFGTGSSGAYFERCGSIPKLADRRLPEDLFMAINCQWGEFSSSELPRNDFDIALDESSANRGQQTYEKMMAGYYLPELLRLTLLHLKEKFPNLFLAKQNMQNLRSAHAMDAACLRTIEEDPYQNYYDSENLFVTKFGISASLNDLEIIRSLAEAIGKRAARLSACVLAALCKKIKINAGVIGVDGSLFILYPHFQERVSDALAEIYGWTDKYEDRPIRLLPAEDGNGVGASLIAAMTMSRVLQGNLLGIKNKAAVS